LLRARSGLRPEEILSRLTTRQHGRLHLVASGKAVDAGGEVRPAGWLADGLITCVGDEGGARLLQSPKTILLSVPGS
jgi:hypothetical protein